MDSACSVYDIVFEAGALLLLALAALVYVLLPGGRRLVLRGRFVGAGWDAGELSISNRESTIRIRDNGEFGMLVRPGDSVTWSIRRQETHLGTMRVDVDAAGGQGPTVTRSMDLGDVNLDTLCTGGEHCQILQLEGATVIIRAVGPRIPAREHQLLDRVPYWLTEHPLSQ